MTRNLIGSLEQCQEPIVRQIFPTRWDGRESAEDSVIRLEGEPTLVEAWVYHRAADRNGVPDSPPHSSRVREVLARHGLLGTQARFHSGSSRIPRARPRAQTRMRGVVVPDTSRFGAECAHHHEASPWNSTAVGWDRRAILGGRIDNGSVARGIGPKRMIRSGIVPIDDLCGGLQPRSAFLLTGGAGAGKTTLSLQFANQGLLQGERVAMITHGSGKGLLQHARQCGIDLGPALREERAVILRYRPDFARRLLRAGSADRAVGDIRRVIAEHRPRRVIIDTFAPLLEDGTSSPIPAAALVEALEGSDATSLLTYGQDVSDGYDRRLEPLIQAAAGIFRVVRDEQGARHLEIVTLRYSPGLESASVEIGAPPLAASLEVR